MRERWNRPTAVMRRCWAKIWRGCLWGLTLSLTSCGDGVSAPPADTVQRTERVEQREVPANGVGLPRTKPKAAEVESADATRQNRAAAPSRVNVTNVGQLRQRIGEEVAVFGRVSRASRAKSGHQFLNFYSSDLRVVCFPEDLAKFRDGEPADLYAEREIELHGKLELYQGKLQIKLRSPAQIQLAGSRQNSELSADPGDGPAAEFQLKKLADDAWLSPAGVVYRGSDPDGLSRLEHVMRHAEDDPQREGSHGVFDGGRDKALQVIDEAWRQVKSQKIRPQLESGREAYTVSLGRRIGYLGGRSGATRRQPPLTRVFIVVREGTSEVVTAFPK